MFHIFVILLQFAVIMAKSTADFFPEINGNLTKITWAHAVNSQKLLDDALNSTVMMLEADIVLGQLNGVGPQLPIMGHPPQNTSDLSLESFFNQISKHNNVTANKKGVKLDFKSTEVFRQSLPTLQQNYNDKLPYPFWINADILKGPVNATFTPVDPDVFLVETKNFTNAVLSIGWTTYYDDNTKNAIYTNDQISEMLGVTARHNVTQTVTYPVRAAIAAESPEQLRRLLGNDETTTLTVWSAANDTVNIPNLRQLILNIGVKRVYLDVPDHVKNELHLDTSGGIAWKSVGILVVLLYILVVM